jgi:hypothetical protein
MSLVDMIFMQSRANLDDELVPVSAPIDSGKLKYVISNLMKELFVCLFYWWALRRPLRGQPGTMASPQGALMPSP